MEALFGEASVFRECWRRVTFVVSYVFRRENLELVYKYLGVVVWNLLLVIVTVPMWLFVKVSLLIVWWRPEYQAKSQQHCKFVVGWAWYLAMKCACCIFRLKAEGIRELNEGLRAGSGNGRLIIMNHTSYMDAVLAGALLDSAVNGEVRALVSSHLFDMPFLGAIVAATGHFPVKFKSLKTSRLPESTFSMADMSVDAGAITPTIQEFENCVREGHVGMWFPEGRLNPHPLQLQMFRAGGFKIAVEVDCEMWCLVSAGLEVFWHRKALVGGVPANCGVKAFRLCSSSHALIQELSAGDRVDDKLKGMLLANHAQAKMQEKRDELSADPWISKLQDLISGEMTGVAMVEYRSGGTLYQSQETPLPRAANSPPGFNARGETIAEETAADEAAEAQSPSAASNAAGAAPPGQAERSGLGPADLLGPVAGDADRAGGGPVDLLGDPEDRGVLRNLESFTG